MIIIIFPSPSCNKGAEEDKKRISHMHSGVSVCLCKLWFFHSEPSKKMSESQWSCWWWLGGFVWASLKRMKCFYWDRDTKGDGCSHDQFSPACSRLLRLRFITVSGNEIRANREWSVMLYGKINVINCAVWLLVEGRGIILNQSLCSGKKKKSFSRISLHICPDISGVSCIMKNTREQKCSFTQPL